MKGNFNNKQMVKKILILVLVLTFSTTINVKASTTSNEVFDKTTSKILSMNEDERVLEVQDGYLISGSNYIKYIYENNEILKVSEEYFTHITDNEYLYLVSKNDEGIFLSKINKKNKKRDVVLLEIDNPIDMKIIDNELVIVGSDRKDAVICKYDKNLNYLHNYYYGGLGYEGFNQIYADGEDYYLIGTKTGQSINSPFLNVGNTKDLKVFLTKINKQGILLDTCYFNHQNSLEELVDSDFKENLIMVKIKTNSDYHIYCLDTNLNTLNYESKSFTANNQSVISNTFKLLTINETNLLTLIVNNQTYDLTKGRLKEVIMDDNVLKVYYYQDHYLWEMKIYQYQILKQEDIVINRMNADFDETMDMNSLDEIKVESFIHKLDLKLEKIDPFFNKQVHGVYNVEMGIVINKDKKYIFTNQIIVEEYINIYDGHTYPVGYNLNFSGYALLDNQSIVSGYKVSQEGLYNLVISDANGNKSKYTFRVVNSDYYRKDLSEIEHLKADYIVNKNEELKVQITTNKEVKEIYVDGESMNFETNEQGIFIKLNMFNNPGMHSFTIDKIVYEKEVYEANKTFLVRVLKDAPVIDIREEDSKNLRIVLDIKDIDQSLENIKFVVYEKDGSVEKIVEMYYLDFLKTAVLVGNIQKDKEYQIKGYFVYDVGLGELVQQEFFDSSFIINMDEYLIIDTDMESNQTEIGLNIYTDNPNLNILKLKVGTTDLKDKYQVVNNYTPIYISIGLSLLVMGIAGGYYFYHKRKAKK